MFELFLCVLQPQHPLIIVWRDPGDVGVDICKKKGLKKVRGFFINVAFWKFPYSVVHPSTVFSGCPCRNL